MRKEKITQHNSTERENDLNLAGAAIITVNIDRQTNLFYNFKAANYMNISY